MRKTSTVLISLISGCVFLVACTNDSGLGLPGQGGSNAAGGSGGSGGATRGSGGMTMAGGMAGGGGMTMAAGGAAGGASGTGGITICPAIACLMPQCQYGTMPSGSPCGCPICASPPESPDASTTTDVTIEKDGRTPDVQLVCNGACAKPACPNGYVDGPAPCHCPMCAPSDGGSADVVSAIDSHTPDATAICLTTACPMIACLNGYQPSPTPCGCPTCTPIDGGSKDTSGIVICDIMCPAIACAGVIVPSPTPCGCPTCGLVTAGN